VSTGPIREPSFKSSSHYFFSGTLFDCSNQLFTFSRVCLILPLPTYQSFSHFSATRKIQNICRAESKVVYKMYLGLLSRITGFVLEFVYLSLLDNLFVNFEIHIWQRSSFVCVLMASTAIQLTNVSVEKQFEHSPMTET
jgi:hypothetical protein